jgi:hypothetical protein
LEALGAAGKQGDKVAETKRIELRVGTDKQVGNVSISTWLPDVVYLSVSCNGGNGSTVALTLEQLRELRRALDEIAPRCDEGLKLAA